MKTFRNMRGFAVICVGLFAGLMTACNKGGDGSSATPVPAPIISPAICSAGTICSSSLNTQGLIATAAGQYISGGTVRAELDLQFYGDPTVLAAMGYGSVQTAGISALGSVYTGAVQARGVLTIGGTGTVVSPVGTGYGTGFGGIGGQVYGTPCNIPPGQYQLQSQSPGMWQNKSFQIQLVGAGGAATLVLILPNNFVVDAIPPVVSATGGSYAYRLQNDVLVNGTCDMVMQ